METQADFSPGRLINRLSRLLNRWGDLHFPLLGLASAQLPVLAMLADGQRLTQKQLAEAAEIEQPTMAQLLARMERDGLIRRTPNPHDKRSTLIALTPRAQQALPAAREHLARGTGAALAGFTPREARTLERLLTRMLHNVETALKQEDDRPPA